MLCNQTANNLLIPPATVLPSVCLVVLRRTFCEHLQSASSSAACVGATGRLASSRDRGRLCRSSDEEEAEADADRGDQLLEPD